MTPSGQTICLCMIVKDEAHVIARCLASVRPLVDHWVVVDTGSRDGTQDIVREAMTGLPGEVVERPWRDFAHNRSEALELARPHGTYSLIIDADDELVLPAGFVPPTLAADSYSIDILYGGTTYRRPQLVSNALPWRYRGVLHEFLECPDAKVAGHLPIVMRINHEGRRSTDPETYARDAAILARALETETDPFLIARYTFYLAQSYRDAGRPADALAAYLQRAELGFWVEEVYVSLHQAGQMMEALGRAPDEIIAIYGRATETLPSRVEAAHAASRLCRGIFRYQQGYDIAKPSLGRQAYAEGLFIKTWIYEYGLYDEYAVNAYWAGHYRDCMDGCLRAMTGGKVPANEVPRFLANMRFALDKLGEGSVPVESAAEAASIEAAPTKSAAAAPRIGPWPKTMNLGSGKNFRGDCLNIDIDPSWNPDAVLDLSRVSLDDQGVGVWTRRFGDVVLSPGCLDRIIANDVLEHVPDLVALMTSCLGLLRTGGVFQISVPFDLSYGAWQDPTHLRAFNERSWLYYTEWFWYLGWTEARFVVDAMDHVPSPVGTALRERGVAWEEILRTPRAIDSMSVTLRKAGLTPDDHATLARWRASRRRDGADPLLRDPDPQAARTPPVALSGSWEEHQNRYDIRIVSRPGYVHHQAFLDPAQALSMAFAALGGSAPIVACDEACDGRTSILFGSHLLSGGQREHLAADAVLFNLEPVDDTSVWMDDSYFALLRRHAVLDYSLRNTEALRSRGLAHVRHLPIRPGALRARPSAPRDIDVLFFGSLNARRSRILDELRGRGLVVEALFGVYGPERDAAVDRAKVVLNVHYYGAAIFESVRIAPLLASGACIVSEGAADDPDSSDLVDGLMLCAYEELADACAGLVADPEARLDMARRASAVAIARPQSAALRGAFSPRA